MKRLILMILFLSITSIGFSDDKPYYLYDMNGNLSKLNLIGTVDNIYVRLGLTVNTYGAQTVAGQKTFSSSIVGNLTGDVTGTASNASALNGESYEHFVTTSTDQTVGGKKTFADLNTSDGSISRVVYSTVTASDISSLIITGLDGNVDKDYYMVIVGTMTGNDTLTLSFNSDTTAANYVTQRLYGVSATVGTDTDTSALGIRLNSANTLQFSNTVHISAKTGFKRVLHGQASVTNSNYTALLLGTWKNSSDNITQIVLTGNIKAGMIITLKARI